MLIDRHPSLSSAKDVEKVFHAVGNPLNRPQVEHGCPALDGVSCPEEFIDQLSIRETFSQAEQALLNGGQVIAGLFNKVAKDPLLGFLVHGRDTP